MLLDVLELVDVELDELELELVVVLEEEVDELVVEVPNAESSFLQVGVTPDVAC